MSGDGGRVLCGVYTLTHTTRKVHLAPKDLALRWFLDYVFDKAPAPADSRVQQIQRLADCNDGSGVPKDLANSVDSLGLDVTYIRRMFPAMPLPDDVKLALANTAPLDQLVWCGLCIYGLNNYGLCSYGLYSYGPTNLFGAVSGFCLAILFTLRCSRP